MTFAIVHTATGVVRRLTTDAEPKVLSDETAVEVADDFDMAGKVKLDLDGKAQPASDAEFDAGMTLPQRPEVQAVIDACNTIIRNEVGQFRDLAVALKAVFDKPRRIDG